MIAKRIFWVLTLAAIAVFALPGGSATLAQTPSPRANSTEDFFKRGVVRYQQGDLDGAFRDFDHAIELASTLSPGAFASNHIGVIFPEPAVMHYNRGVTRYDLHDSDGAIADLDEALKLNPHYVNAWIKRGNARMSKGELDEAIKDFNEAIRLSPRSTLAWNNRGLARQNKGELDAALNDYARALELDPLLPAALNNRAGIKHDRGDLRSALKDYDQAIAIDPTLAFVFNNRGLTRKKLGDLQGAMADYNEAIRLRPNFSLAYFNRSAAWKAMGKGFEAERDFVRSLESDDNPALLPEPGIEKIESTIPERLTQPHVSATEVPEVSLCKMTAQAKEYAGKTVCVSAKLQAIYFGDLIVGLTLSDRECESIEALFDKPADEEAVLERLTENRGAELAITATGSFHSDQQANYGPFGALSHLLLIKSYEIGRPPAQAAKSVKP